MLLFLWKITFFFLVILVFGYLLPAGQFYLCYDVFRSERTEQMRIRQRTASRKDIALEVRYSLLTVLIFGFLAALLWRRCLAGETAIYWDLSEYLWWYHALSFVLVLIFHDTYFYWTHRLMHWRPLFKCAHRGHHRSLTPTPWAIFAFQPLEAVIQFGILAFPVLFLPLHPSVLLVYLMYDSFVNTAGHSGHEIFPR